jgi:hypothetical protein
MVGARFLEADFIRINLRRRAARERPRNAANKARSRVQALYTLYCTVAVAGATACTVELNSKWLVGKAHQKPNPTPIGPENPTLRMGATQALAHLRPATARVLCRRCALPWPRVSRGPSAL